MDIAISGAGIGGLAAAAALAQDGHRVVIYDQFEAPEPVGSGLVVQPVGLKALDRIGAKDAAMAQGNRVHRMFGHEVQQGRPVLDVSYDAPGDPRYGLAIHRAALFEAIYDAAQHAGVTIVPNHRVIGRDGQRLLFSNGLRSDPAHLIVDATGAGSVLSPMRARTLTYGALWSTVLWPAETRFPRNELRQAYRRADRMLGVLPLGQVPGRVGFCAAIFWSLRADGYEQWLQDGLAHWQEEAVSHWPDFAPFAAQITDPAQMTMARYAHGTMASPVADGIVHIGDAAHRASPQLGQGANMALLDAWSLAQALRRARGDVSQALQIHARARRWHVRSYQLMSRLFTPMYQSDSRILPVLRNRVLYPVSTLVPVQNALTSLVCGDLLPPLGSLEF